MNLMKRLTLLLVLVFSFAAFGKDAINIKVPLTASSFNITAKKIYGKVKDSNGTFKAKELYVKAKKLKTGMDLRDEHMKNKDRLHVDKYKKIKIVDMVAKNGKGKAFIIIKNKKKPIKFKYKISGGKMHANFKLNVKKFPLKGLSYMGIGVKGTVHVKAIVPVVK